MKRIILLLIAVTAFGCSSDDPAIAVNQPVNIEGTWRVMSVTTYTGEVIDVSDCETQPDAAIITFTNDGVYIKDKACENGADVHQSGTYTVQGNTLVYNVIEPFEIVSKTEITYVSDNKIKIRAYWNNVNGDVENSPTSLLQKI